MRVVVLMCVQLKSVIFSSSSTQHVEHINNHTLYILRYIYMLLNLSIPEKCQETTTTMSRRNVRTSLRVNPRALAHHKPPSRDTITIQCAERSHMRVCDMSYLLDTLMPLSEICARARNT